MKYLVLLFLYIPLVHAQLATEKLPTEGSDVVPVLVRPEQSPVEEVVEGAQVQKISTPILDKAQRIETEISKTKYLRDDSTGSIMVGYQFLTSWLPSKKTISYTHIFNQKWSLEGEYSWASINFPIVGVDLGEIKEKRYTLEARRYVGNSFHFTFGAVLNEFKARLGSDFLDNLGNEIHSDFEVHNIGVTGGIGNRWQWQNGFTLGLDWFRINIPVAETKLEDNVLDDIPGGSDRKEVKKVIRALNRIPTFVLFGVNLGYTF